MLAICGMLEILAIMYLWRMTTTHDACARDTEMGAEFPERDKKNREREGKRMLDCVYGITNKNLRENFLQGFPLLQQSKCSVVKC